MKLVVRLDVSKHIGTGHWRRMTNLVAAMPEASPVYVVRTDQPTSQLFSGHRVEFLQTDDDLPALEAICRSQQAKVALVDLLHYPHDYLQRLKRRTGCKVVSFHEYDYPDAFGDLSVNYNTFEGFEKAGSESFLAGPDYCIFSPELLSTRRQAATHGVLAFFGGSDPSGFAGDFIRHIVPALPQISFIMHSGPLCHAPKPFEQNAPANARWTDVSESFYALMGGCRVLVTSGGNSMYEAMYVGLKPLVVAHNKHQATFAANAARAGACQFFGMHPSVDWSRLAETLGREYPQPSAPQRRLTDGRGIERLTGRIRQLCA